MSSKNDKNKKGSNKNNGNVRKSNNTTSSNFKTFQYDSVTKQSNNVPDTSWIFDLFSSLEKKIVKLEEDNKYLETNINRLEKDIKYLQTQNNKIVNRFGWTLIIINFGIGILVLLGIITCFKFGFPILGKLGDGIVELVSIVIGLAIASIFRFWWLVHKDITYIKNRDQKNKKSIQ